MKRILLAAIVFCMLVCGFACAELAAPQNPAWVEGSTATATWDAVESADYYELNVSVYDETGTLFLGSMATGTSETEADVQLQANIVINEQETEYSAVKLAYTVKASVTDSDGTITYGAESDLSPMWDYTFALIQLQPPEDIVLNEDGTASWKAVEGAGLYTITLYGYAVDDPSHKQEVLTSYSVSENSGDMFSCDLSSQIGMLYDFFWFTNGEKIKINIIAYSSGSFTNNYIDSENSAPSNYIEYFKPPKTKLPPPENIELKENGTASWKAVEGAGLYTITLYGYAVDDPSHKQEVLTSYSVSENSGDMFSCDLSSQIGMLYGFFGFTNGEKIRVYIIAYSSGSLIDNYIDSEDSAPSNYIVYAPWTPVESFTLSPAQPVVYVGNSYHLGITITPEDAYYSSVDWSTTDAATVTVDSTGLITGVKAGEAEVTAVIGDAEFSVPVMVYDISSNIEDEDAKNEAGDIIDDLVNKDNPDVSDTDIPEENLGDIQDEVREGIWRGDEFFTDMNWYEQEFGAYKNNWGQIQKAARLLNAQFAGAYNIEVEMYHKEKDGSTIHPIGCIEEFENDISFAFDLPTGMDEIRDGYARKYVLVRIHRNEIDTVAMDCDGEQVLSSSNSFSDFILLYVDTPTEPVDLSGLSTLTLPASIVSVEAEAFAGTAAEVVVIPEGCRSIGSRAFAGCANLKYIVVPSDWDITPANDAFDGCTAEILYQ